MLCDMNQGDQSSDTLSSNNCVSTRVGSLAEHVESSRFEEGYRGVDTAVAAIAPVDEGSERQPEKQSDYRGVNVALYKESDWRRDFDEEDFKEEWREEWRRDYARVIHSPSFRRLQGKCQLFPGHESDFFRNRLTHSLEVSQIAEAIAYRLNHNNAEYFRDDPINTRLCATAGLIHDLGHPPFGHNGEHALDDKMRQYGGFEGNAQTLRLIARLEKKITRTLIAEDNTGIAGSDGNDERVGLNLTYRTLAAVLKYDRIIPAIRDNGEALVKGYYAEEAEYVKRIKKAVEPSAPPDQPFKTIECSIMDIADDIAYSTYDLEDSFKAGFLTPADMLASNDELLERVAHKVSISTDKPTSKVDILEVFWSMFSEMAEESDSVAGAPGKLYEVIRSFSRSKEIAASGYLRTDFTSQLVGDFINCVCIDFNPEHPALSKVYLEPIAHKKVEILKNYTYEATIFSTRLKVAEFRGYEVVAGIFESLAGNKGYLLLPDDTRALYHKYEANATARMRVICDFVAGMTDRYALEYYARLHFDTPQSFFKPI